MRHRARLRTSLLTLSLAIVSCVASAQTIPRETRMQLLEAVVQVIPYDVEAGEPVPWSGSGTIISPDGYILTNFHVIGDLDTRSYYDWHAILVTDPAFTDQPPNFRYWARYVAADPTHDLAIIKIEEYADETPVPAGTTFPSVPVGDSNALLPGDPIVIVGYPGISGATITFTSGTMSGWLGEDFETGGKQWIKTDAKIAHGNSGGAAFNLDGELIGVPTAGRTIQYEALDVEEQAYVRPIGLAWAVIGPNVANVRRGGTTASQPAPAPTTPTPTTTPAPVAAASTAAGEPSGEYGEVALGAPVTSRIAAAPADGFTYHGYSVAVPAGTSRLEIRVDGHGNDIDLAVNVGAPIEDYENVDHLDTSVEPNPTFAVDAPGGNVWVDVINLLGTPSDYTLVVTSSGAAQPGAANPLAPGGNTTEPQTTNPLAPTTSNPLAPPATQQALPAVTAPMRTAGTVGALQLGQTATGQLEGAAEAAPYHTYFVDLPPGTHTVTIRMTADIDLDLAAKLGGEIDSYTDAGNWDVRDVTTATSAELVIPNAQGRLYIDVFNALGAGAVGSYTLDVR